MDRIIRTQPRLYWIITAAAAMFVICAVIIDSEWLVVRLESGRVVEARIVRD